MKACVLVCFHASLSPENAVVWIIVVHIYDVINVVFIYLLSLLLQGTLVVTLREAQPTQIFGQPR